MEGEKHGETRRTRNHEALRTLSQFFFSSHTHAGFPAMRERWTGAWSELTSRRVGRSGASPSGEEAACEGALC